MLVLVVIWVGLAIARPAAMRLPFRGGPLVLAIVLASLWQVTPWKRRRLRACQRSLPLAPRGWKALASCARFGAVYGTHCVGSCWSLMLVASMTAHRLSLMVLLTAIVLLERSVGWLRRAPAALAPFGLAVAAWAASSGTPGGGANLLRWACRVVAN
jgi:predicted metal-binding membrane protein